MTLLQFFVYATLLPAVVSCSPAALTPILAPPVSKVILDMSAGSEKHLQPTSEQVIVARSREASEPGIKVVITPGSDGYPGVTLKPSGASWNLSRFGHVEARVVNTGDKPLSIALRVDNAGDWKEAPWNTESVTLEPGKSGTVTTIFGYSYGYKPGYALKPAAIVSLMLFTGKAETAQSFRLESLEAGGVAGETPPVAPEAVRIRPKGGLLLGAGIPADATVETASAAEQSVSVKPAQGRWDLRDFLEVRVQVRNVGLTPVTPRARLESNGGVSGWTVGSALLPGKAEEITLPFAEAVPRDLSQKDTDNHITGNHITSDAVSAITLAPQNASGIQKLHAVTIQADRPSMPLTPSWLGKRPPVTGRWVKTLDEEFTGKTLNQSLWSVYGDNYWDKQTHWSKADVLVSGGLVKLRYEKKTGFSNDDPKQKPSDYAAGYLHTYGKWVQRYGYFEARMKLPTAPGLWPAFWMMPDRGKAAGPEQSKRQDTANGGMEFDIMEHLTRWGPSRYNIAMHYDGYGTDHKQIGSDKIYVQPDKEGFITCGLLWTPGLAIYYCNGREVLRWKNPRISNIPEILMFTLPMGGWDNSSLDAARLPDDFVIDYVRVWQRKDLASGADGAGK